jgi:cytochrome c oxidase cbb3-type subunit 3
MSENLTDHNYDGIQEYDSPLPGWWKLLFWATTLFAIPYLIWYHLMGNTIAAGYAEETARAAEIEAGRVQLDQSAAGLFGLMADAERFDAGRKTWNVYCMPCHVADGGGLVGPNMTDDYYIHVRKIEDLPGVVREGRVEKGMSPWRGILSDNQIAEVSAYVASLRGTKPATPKEPQGEAIPPWTMTGN